MNQVSANDYKHVMEALGVAGDLGCIMLDTEKVVVSDVIKADDIYVDPETESPRFLEGLTSEVEPHITLLYGLMRPGPAWKWHVDEILKGLTIESPRIKEVGFFYNADDRNVAIVAFVEVSDSLLEANTRLKLLPHVDTYPEYRPHLTLAYVKDTADYQSYIKILNERLQGKELQPVGINYGD
jgi:hypothetical protein